MNNNLFWIDLIKLNDFMLEKFITSENIIDLVLYAKKIKNECNFETKSIRSGFHPINQDKIETATKILCIPTSNEQTNNGDSLQSIEEFQVNCECTSCAKNDATFMHCLSEHSGVVDK